MDWRLTSLDPAERDLVIESALAVLERVGMHMQGARAVDLLESQGARADRDTGIVKIPEAVVRTALDSLPEKLFIAGATPAQDVVLDCRSGPVFNPAGCMAKTLDFRTGQVRPSMLEDLREGTVVMDATSEIDVMWTFATANDVPVERRERVEYYTYLTNTAKPLVFVDCPSEVDDAKRVMDVLGNGLDGFRRRPRLALLMAARAPLGVNGKLLDTACEFARLGAPIWAFTMPLSGATGPVTIAGTLTLMWAELLGMLTAVQAAAPGAGVLACCGPGVLDMKTSSISLGGLENTIAQTACVAIGHHLGLPVHCSALATDAKHPGIQAGYEKGFKTLAAALAGADEIGAGFGALESSSMFHLPMIPIDAEIAAMARRLLAGARVDQETIMLEAFERVGVGGSFLKEKITRDRIRAGEHFYPTIASRLPFEQWVAEGKQETDVARERVEQILVGSAAQGREGAASLLGDAQLEALADVCGVNG